ncbi:MAG TPA: type II toxin-antitoxin system VapC family toxin [Propylenella sp.]
MRLLLDTNILVAIVENRTQLLDSRLHEAVSDSDNELSASVASLWEIAIKVRLRKLPLHVPLSALPELFAGAGLRLLSIEAGHVLVEVAPLPNTRDPFDRLLLAQCLVENLRLVTTDRVLTAHPLSWRPG